MNHNTKSGLSRPVHPMPDFVEAALAEHGLTNDYLGWIMKAKRPETRQKRLDQMLDELRRGGVYMNMKHPPSVRTRP